LDQEILAKRTSHGVHVDATKCKDWMPPPPLALTPLSVPVEIAENSTESSTLVLCRSGIEAIRLEKVDEIKQLRRDGKSFRSIERLTGVSKSKAARICRLP